MRTAISVVLLLAGTSLLQGSIIETISIDLSALHPGSTLSGTFTLSDTPAAGDSAPVSLSFSDPMDYSPTSLMGSITIGSGTFLPYTVGFDTLSFTNPGGNMFTKEVNLNPAGMAQCASFPCTAVGRFEDNNPAAFAATYSIAPAGSSVPEPVYGMLLPVVFGGLALGRRWNRRRS